MQQSEKRTDVGLIDALMEQNRGWLTAYLVAVTGEPSAAEDLVQEVFLKALGIQDRYDASRPLGAWLRGIARNVAHEYWRQSGKRPVITDSESLEALDAASESGVRTWTDPDRHSQRLAALRECMKKLSSRVMGMLQKKYAGNLASKSIGKPIGVKAATVNVTISRARKALFECIELRLEDT